MTTNKNVIEGKRFYNKIFSFEVCCNAEGTQEIRNDLIEFLQSKNWVSKNIRIAKRVY